MLSFQESWYYFPIGFDQFSNKQVCLVRERYVTYHGNQTTTGKSIPELSIVVYMNRWYFFLINGLWFSNKRNWNSSEVRNWIVYLFFIYLFSLDNHRNIFLKFFLQFINRLIKKVDEYLLILSKKMNLF
jgi:hypothetical protein